MASRSFSTKPLLPLPLPLPAAGVFGSDRDDCCESGLLLLLLLLGCAGNAFRKNSSTNSFH